MLGLARRMQMDDLVPRVFNAARRPGRPAPPVMATSPGADGVGWRHGTDQDGAQDIAGPCCRPGLACPITGGR